jgi:hypothetical protein
MEIVAQPPVTGNPHRSWSCVSENSAEGKAAVRELKTVWQNG